MPAPELMLIADAVVSQLNAASLVQTFTAVRLYQPKFELPDMQTLHVSVVPCKRTVVKLTRSRNVNVYIIQIGVQKKFNAVTEAALNTELDPLVKLVDDILALFDSNRLTSVPTAICTAQKPDPIYAQDHMDQFRQFTSILTLEFKDFG